ncbi:hypothetical protein ACLOCA_08745 [Limosilactobacillus fermentum]|uniref:hypothetical protein n=1 Tax=Limosilactobacillus fermentum TaxID=1613 RepID=UPI003EBFAEE8
MFGEIFKYQLYIWVIDIIVTFVLGAYVEGLLGLYYYIWSVIVWRRLYVKVLTEEGYKPVATSTVSTTSNTNSYPTAPHAQA